MIFVLLEKLLTFHFFFEPGYFWWSKCDWLMIKSIWRGKVFKVLRNFMELTRTSIMKFKFIETVIWIFPWFGFSLFSLDPLIWNVCDLWCNLDFKKFIFFCFWNVILQTNLLRFSFFRKGKLLCYFIKMKIIIILFFWTILTKAWIILIKSFLCCKIFNLAIDFSLNPSFFSIFMRLFERLLLFMTDLAISDYLF